MFVGVLLSSILFGLDKLSNLMVNREQNPPPFVNNFTGGHGHYLMLAVGVIEIIAGSGGPDQTQSFRLRRLSMANTHQGSS